MLIEFSVENYLSFRKRVTFSLNSASVQEFKDENCFDVGKYRLLKGAAIYGANASGKSNLIKAMFFLRNFVLRSAQNMQIADEINIQPFKLNSQTDNTVSAFEIVFICEGTTYKYGIEVDRKTVVNERLHTIKSSHEKLLFQRQRTQFILGDGFEEGENLNEKTRENALFLSVVAQFNGSISKKIFDWFNKTNFILGMEDNSVSREISKELLSNKEFHAFMLGIMQSADIGLLDIVSKERSGPARLRPAYVDGKLTITTVKLTGLFSLHRKFDDSDKDAGEVEFDFDSEESDGTRKLFRYTGPIYRSLFFGERLIVDELDFGLHPILTRLIVSLFNSKKTNQKNAQLVFVTHDTNLLSAKLLRRDQVWLIEKDQFGATDLYSLIEYKIRNDASFEKDYLQGRYGAIPFLTDPNITIPE